MFRRIFLIMLIAIPAQGADEWFSFIQPLDNYMQEKLKWENEMLATDLNDWMQLSVVALPYVSLLDERDGLRKASGFLAGHLFVGGGAQIV